jgi:hypothetical protein
MLVASVSVSAGAIVGNFYHYHYYYYYFIYIISIYTSYVTLHHPSEI